jgi:hypothetical protein
LVATDGTLTVRDVVVDSARLSSAAAPLDVVAAWRVRFREVRDAMAAVQHG